MRSQNGRPHLIGRRLAKLERRSNDHKCERPQNDSKNNAWLLILIQLGKLIKF